MRGTEVDAGVAAGASFRPVRRLRLTAKGSLLAFRMLKAPNAVGELPGVASPLITP